MNFLKLKFLKNLPIFNTIIILFFFIYSIFVVRYQYDGHHLGLIYSNANDLIKGKLPYKEIFIQYGFLTTLIHSLILLLFDNKFFFISFFTIVFYFLGIYFISKSVNELISKEYAIIATVVILFNHPIPWLPWSNYIVFFFISVCFYFLSIAKKKFFLISLFLGLAILTRQDSFIPIIFSFILYFIFYFLNNGKVYMKNIIKCFFGFLLPTLLFLSYLILYDIYDVWLNYLTIPSLYLELYNASLFDLIFDYIIFFSINSFLDFIYVPQYFLISIILISNSIIILLKIINKIEIPNNVFYITLLSLFLSSLSLKIELFRLYTSVVFGLIPLLYLLNNIKNNELKRNLNLLIILPAIYSFIFYPYGGNKQFYNKDFVNSEIKLLNNHYDYFIWPETKITSINEITNLSNKCDVQFLDNLTFDTMLSTVGLYDRIRLLPYEKSSLKYSKLHLHINSIKNPNQNFVELINSEIKNQNIILLINENNNIYKNSEIKFTSFYNSIEINVSNVVGKPKILRIYYPSKCFL